MTTVIRAGVSLLCQCGRAPDRRHIHCEYGDPHCSRTDRDSSSRLV